MKALISRNHLVGYRRSPHRLNNPIKRKPDPSFSTETCVVDLSCYGDVLHVLPLLHYLKQVGPRPTLVVNPRLGDLAKSISYADVKTASDWETALGQAKMNFKNVLHTKQSVPPGTHGDPDCGWGFMEKVYKNFGGGLYEQYLAGNFEDIKIDKRDEKAEKALVARVLGDYPGPFVLVNTSGISSPFKDGGALTSALAMALVDTPARVVDISDVRAEKFTDMLGLFDRATLFVSSDSGLLHLAGAHGKVPYVALLRDTGLYTGRPTWMSAGRTLGNCVMKLGYSEFRDWLPWIKRVVRGTVYPDKGRRIIHAHSVHADATGSTRRRNQLAEVTWRTNYALGNWTPAPCPDSVLDRFFDDGKRMLPYVRDVIDFSLPADTRPDDLIFLTNADTCLSAALTDQIYNLDGSLAHFHRRDFGAPMVFPTHPKKVTHGRHYGGTDAFLFPFAWWNKNRNSVPDLVIAGEAWDAVLREMLKKSGAKGIPNCLFHEEHASLWSNMRYRYSNPMNLYNLKLAKSKLQSMGLNYRGFGIA